ncbi:MAG: nitrate reductase cytochrome c-type subunit [Campylobacterota bacterium]|nr:nitrate reductase cytochrome c-type subunit [Campylobacterota bacterium]
MKTISKITLSLTIASSIFMAGCTTTVSEESLGLRKTNLYTEEAETTGDETRYGSKAAGTSVKIERAFQDAPPMIPHDVEGMLPITMNNNQCVGCHMPGVAESLVPPATPYPISHMTDFRPTTKIANDGRIELNGKAVDNTSEANRGDMSIKELATLSGSRFNCSQCHAPQSDATDAPANTFEAVFSDEDGATKSSWTGSRLTDDLDTLIK